MPTIAKLFLDTQVLLHFKPLKDIDWRELVNEDEVELIISRAVTRELDKHKNTHRSKKIRERARRIIRNIEDWSEEEMGFLIRDGVRVFHYGISNIDLKSKGLNPEWADDVLLGTILDYIESNPSAQVFIVSDDANVRIEAKRLGISAIKLTDDLRLPEERDPIEIKKEELEKQISKLRAPIVPTLFLSLPEGQKYIKYELPQPSPESSVSMKEEMDKLRKEYLPRPKITNEKAMLGMFSPLPEEVDRFNSELEKFFDVYDAYLNLRLTPIGTFSQCSTA